jgi:hypothetical protein
VRDRGAALTGEPAVPDPLHACLIILGDIGGAEAKATLSRFVGDRDPRVARAATDGLSTIAMKDKMDRGEDPFPLDI